MLGEVVRRLGDDDDVDELEEIDLPMWDGVAVRPARLPEPALESGQRLTGSRPAMERADEWAARVQRERGSIRCAAIRSNDCCRVAATGTSVARTFGSGGQKNTIALIPSSP